MSAFQQKNITLHLVGDSTMADKKNPEINPEFGWGQVLPTVLNNTVSVVNHAVNGRSTKSFITEGKWQKVTEELKPGDYVLIQFGHNDQKYKDPERYTNPYSSYRDNLMKMITESRDKGAIPILFSSVVRRKFNEFGTLVDTHGTYPYVMRELAQQCEVPFIDMQLASEMLVAELGPEKSKEIYLWLEPEEDEYHPKGKQDNTHFNKKGAIQMANLAIELMKPYGFEFLD
ncbi:MAG: rhamnogalacturonan acetylesterase [Reichenbachiella sp.]